MKTIHYSIVVLSVLLFSAHALNSVYAHTDIHVGDVTVEVGWQQEPPLVGELNAITFEFTKEGDTHDHYDHTPFVIDRRDVTVEVRYGGVTRTLDLVPTDQLGFYKSPIIPTRLGSYTIVLKGMIDGHPVDAQIPIEDVEDKQRLAFPDATAESTELRNIASQIQSSVNQLQVTVDQVAGKIGDAESSAIEARQIASDMRADAERAYSFGMIGMGLGAAGVIVAIAALTRGRKADR